jgi:hypothetical protein
MVDMSTANKTAAFKARARALDAPSLLLLWDALKADPQTSFSLLLWVGAEYQRRVKAER